MKRDFFYWCIRELNVPVQIYREYGISALSYSEREKVLICHQLQSKRKPIYNEMLFDEKELERIKRFISTMVGDDGK